MRDFVAELNTQRFTADVQLSWNHLGRQLDLHEQRCLMLPGRHVVGRYLNSIRRVAAVSAE